LIDGAINDQSVTKVDDLGEASLDLQYGIALSYPQKVKAFVVGDQIQSASFNNFLDALDASYCTSGGGDDPNQ
jgi:tripeptidyl-peptidase-1